MTTIEFLEELNKTVTKQAIELEFDSPEFAALEQIKRQIDWHKNALRHSTSLAAKFINELTK